MQRAFPEVGPANVKGIEINPYAAELARVSVWIGEIQWMRRNGFAESTRPDPEAAGHDRVSRRGPAIWPDAICRPANSIRGGEPAGTAGGDQHATDL